MRLRLPESRLVAGLWIGLGGLAILVVIGLIALWPRGTVIDPTVFAGSLDTEQARVVGVDPEGCRAGGSAPSELPVDCQRVSFELLSGPEKGLEAGFDLGADVAVSEGDRIRVSRAEIPEGVELGGVEIDLYSFSDFERRAPLLWLTLLFAALVIGLARWRGVRALIGLTGSLFIIVLFIVPSILSGNAPVLVAVIGALAVMLITIPLAHGISPITLSACLGTAAALIATVLLAELFVDLAHITGFASEEATILRAASDELSIQGLLLAGIVIAALGVLDDLTVTQASTVAALRRARPDLGAMPVFREAMRVGQDHVVATVNTLVLAYAGASLPILLIFSVADTPFLDAVNAEVVAAEIVATLVGSIGLILAVPVTTALAAVVAARTPTEELGEVHAH